MSELVWSSTSMLRTVADFESATAPSCDWLPVMLAEGDVAFYGV